jgi:Protein of unknown function (DUF3450)
MRLITKGLLAGVAAFGASVAAAQGNNDPAAAYEAVLKEAAGVEVYNELVGRQIEAQQQELADLQAAIEQVPALERQAPALLERMVQGLEEFVRLDLPFYPDIRAESLTELRSVLERADVSDADKFRRVLEAWQIEAEYGNSFTTYVGQLEISGAMREVDFLQVGRIALLYQTTDEEAITGAWDQSTKSWVSLDSEHRNSVRQALRMARNQIAPELVLLPISPPSAE